MYKVPHLKGGAPQFVLITPRIAAEWLKLNTSNRNLRDSTVTKYARDIREGRWSKNGDSIRFSKTSKLLDGQHRLNAIIEAGIAVEMLVIAGLDDETQATMDIGARRSAGDALKLDGINGGKNIAAVIRKILLWEQGDHNLNGNIPISNTEIQEFFRSNASASQRSTEIASRVYSKFRDIPPSVVGTAHYVTYRLDAGVSVEFFERLGSGTMLDTGNPILTLRTKASIDKGNRRAVSEGVHLNQIFHAWNAVRAGKSLNRMVLPQSGIALPK